MNVDDRDWIRSAIWIVPDSGFFLFEVLHPVISV